MTKKDFIQWASVLSRFQIQMNKCRDDAPDRQRVYDWWAEEIVDILRGSNPRFDAQRFQDFIDVSVERIESGRQ